MLRKLRARRPSHATVVAYLGLFVALGGTGAYAANEWTGENIVNESLTHADVQNGSLLNGDLAPNSITSTRVATETLTTSDILNSTIENADLKGNSITSSRVAANTLTSDDIDEANVSGLNRCPAGTTRLGRLCADSDGTDRNWQTALDYCEGRGLRVPSYSEAREVGENHDIPDVSDNDNYWSDEVSRDPDGSQLVVLVASDAGSDAPTIVATTTPMDTVCVATPLN